MSQHPSPEDIESQFNRLERYRANVRLILEQISARGGVNYASLEQLNALASNRASIAECKSALRGWGVQVADHPDDKNTKYYTHHPTTHTSNGFVSIPKIFVSLLLIAGAILSSILPRLTHTLDNPSTVFNTATIASTVNATVPLVDTTRVASDIFDAAARNRVVVKWYIGLSTGTNPFQNEVIRKIVNDFNESQDKIYLTLQIVDNTVAYSTYLIKNTTLLKIHGGLPIIKSEQLEYFKVLDDKFAPNKINWQVAIDSLLYLDIPNHEEDLPNFFKARDSITDFGTLMRSNSNLNIDVQAHKLQNELQTIFNENK